MFGLQNLGAMITTVVTLPFILIILGVILVFARSARKANASKRWSMTTGTIASSEVTSHRSLDSDGTHTTIYDPAVTYQYSVNGQRYQSNQISFGSIAGTSFSSWAEGVVANYPAGSSVQVFYNPANPSEAVLEHSGGGGNTLLMLIFIGVELILVAILALALMGHFG